MTGLDPDRWRHIVSVEYLGCVPGFFADEQRRAFRPYAQVPPR